MCDIVYAFKHSDETDDLELKLSLRSIEKYGQNVGDIVLVGDIPEWAINVKHISVEDKYTRETNVFNKIMTACKGDVSETFLFMNDDFIMTKAFNCNNYPNFICAKEVLPINRPSRWQRVQNKTIKVLQKPVLDFRSHCPIIMKKSKVLQLEIFLKEAKLSNVGYSLRLLYGNTFCLDYVYAEDCKLWDNDKIEDNIQGCISTKDDDKRILNELLAMFPKKSKYEK